jgi:metal-responsive CopG/Arc/MetJ family transcriptional regulator
VSHRLQVRIPEELHERLRAAADRDRITRSEWVRRAVGKALKFAEEMRRADALARLTSLQAPVAEIDQMLAEIEAGRRI